MITDPAPSTPHTKVKLKWRCLVCTWNGTFSSMGVAWSKSKQVRGHRQAALTQQRMRSDPPLFCVLLILITEVTSFFEKKQFFNNSLECNHVLLDERKKMKLETATGEL